jgi:hypothetical protein
MTATAIRTQIELSCRNDAGAGVGERVTVLEWVDSRQATSGRVAVPTDQAEVHATQLAGQGGAVVVRECGEGTVARVIQWFRLGRSGDRVPARVIVVLD